MSIQNMAGHLIRRVHQISTQAFASGVQAAGFRITPVQFAAMGAIKNHPGIDQAQVAALIAYDRATIGGVIDRLEKRGLVERSISQRDRRAREVSLSAEGLRFFEELLPVVGNLQGEILSALDAQEQAIFLALSAKIAAQDVPEQA